MELAIDIFFALNMLVNCFSGKKVDSFETYTSLVYSKRANHESSEESLRASSQNHMNSSTHKKDRAYSEVHIPDGSLKTAIKNYFK